MATNTHNLKLKRQAEPRRERAAKLRAAGETWTEIGTILGISRQRAQQLAAAYRKRK
jgi:DNA-directed RNA polymerase sigma subunit (sigma70/sigma32)